MTYNNKVYKWTCSCGYIAKTRKELLQHRKEFQCSKKYNQPNIEWTCKFCGCERFSPKYAKTYHEKYCKDNPDRIILKGHKVSEETKKKISEGMKKAHAEGRANEWQGRRERSYAEQSWYNIFANDLGEKTFINNYFVKKYWLDFAWPDKKIYFEVDGRTHFTEEGLKHDLERTEFLKKEGWDLIGRCNWSEYQKLSREEKEKYVTEVENSIRTSIIKDNLIMEPTKNINRGRAEIEKRFNKNGHATMKALPEEEWLRREKLIISSGVDITKFGWIKKIMKVTNLTKHQVYDTIEHSSFIKENCYKQ